MIRSRLILSTLFCTILTLGSIARAQQNAFVGGFNVGGQNNGGFQGGIGNNPGGNGQGQGQGNGFRGGAANADFASLIDLITSTILPDSWVDNGGTADIRPFPGGVWIDPAGVLRLAEVGKPIVKLTSLGSLPSLRPPALPHVSESAPADPRQLAKLRCVSLPRLEAQIIHRIRDGRPLEESMLVLAGLQRIEYVFIYPDLGDLVLAGPAGDWKLDDAGRLVSTETRAPVVRLDDLLTLMRREHDFQGKPFGCSITPRQNNLAATQSFLDKSSATPLRPGKVIREKWLEQLRTTLGRQDIEVFGLDPGTHAAHVLVKADHHMKRVGIGLADGVVGVDSYLDTIVREKKGEQPLSVLRWWFSTNYQSVARNDAGTAYVITGQGVCVLSENELLKERGERVHTGRADAATQEFAHQFTNEFAALCQKYPVYGELRNLFDLAIVAAMLDAGDLYAAAGWQPMLFLDAEHLPLPKYRAPKEVDTILNHRVVNKTKILAAVSGGVWIDSGGVLKSVAAASKEQIEKLDYHRERMPVDVKSGDWWWDLE
ncbi:MAG: DUF1598 domain-containing protein [Aeoliella sp.]